MAPTQHWLWNHRTIIHSIVGWSFFMLFIHFFTGEKVLPPYLFSTTLYSSSSKAFLNCCPRMASSNFYFPVSALILYLPIVSFFHLHLIQGIFLFSNLNTFLFFSALSLLLTSVSPMMFTIFFFFLFSLLFYYPLIMSCIPIVSKMQGP